MEKLNVVHDMTIIDFLQFLQHSYIYWFYYMNVFIMSYCILNVRTVRVCVRMFTCMFTCACTVYSVVTRCICVKLLYYNNFL